MQKVNRETPLSSKTSFCQRVHFKILDQLLELSLKENELHLTRSMEDIGLSSPEPLRFGCISAFIFGGQNDEDLTALKDYFEELYHTPFKGLSRELSDYQQWANGKFGHSREFEEVSELINLLGKSQKIPSLQVPPSNDFDILRFRRVAAWASQFTIPFGVLQPREVAPANMVVPLCEIREEDLLKSMTDFGKSLNALHAILLDWGEKIQRNPWEIAFHPYRQKTPWAMDPGMMSQLKKEKKLAQSPSQKTQNDKRIFAGECLIAYLFHSAFEDLAKELLIMARSSSNEIPIPIEENNLFAHLYQYCLDFEASETLQEGQPLSGEDSDFLRSFENKLSNFCSKNSLPRHSIKSLKRVILAKEKCIVYVPKQDKTLFVPFSYEETALTQLYNEMGQFRQKCKASLEAHWRKHPPKNETEKESLLIQLKALMKSKSQKFSSSVLTWRGINDLLKSHNPNATPKPLRCLNEFITLKDIELATCIIIPPVFEAEDPPFIAPLISLTEPSVQETCLQMPSPLQTPMLTENLVAFERSEALQEPREKRRECAEEKTSFRAPIESNEPPRFIISQKMSIRQIIAALREHGLSVQTRSSGTGHRDIVPKGQNKRIATLSVHSGSQTLPPKTAKNVQAAVNQFLQTPKP